MIFDLVSPWLAAVEATDSTRARSAFRNRHAPLFEALRRARTPTSDTLPLATDATQLRTLARRTADPATQQLLRETVARAAALGADRCDAVVLVAGSGAGDATQPLPRPGCQAIIFADQVDDDTGFVVALARSVAALTRWGAPDSKSPLAQGAGGAWNPWEASRNVALREWIYTEGLGIHLAEALLPELEPHRLFNLNHTAFNRLREREKVFRALLDDDLDERGIGLVLRWLTPGAPLGPRTIGGVVLPPTAGHYLAWRMTAERVARVGLRDAIRAEA